MVSVYVIDKVGLLKKAFTGLSIFNGQLDWAGGENFYAIAPSALIHCQINNSGVSLLRTLAFFGNPPGGRAVCLPRFYAGGEHEDHEAIAGDKLVVGTNVVGVPNYTVRWYDRLNGGLVKEFGFDTVTDWGGIATNGYLYFVAYMSSAIPADPRIKLVDIRQDGLFAIRDLSVSALLYDLCHDGAFLWGTDGVNIHQYEQQGRTPPRLVRIFAAPAGSANVYGLATNGDSLFLLARG